MYFLWMYSKSSDTFNAKTEKSHSDNTVRMRLLLAEKEGFEPSVQGLVVHTISNRAHSTTLTSLRI